MAPAAWYRSYEPGVPPSLGSVAEPFHVAFLEAAAEAPGEPALESLGRSFSFAELEALSARVATSLRQDGIVGGEPVVCALTPSAVALAIMLGILRCGGVVVPVMPEPQWAFGVVRAVRPRFAFASPRLAASWSADTSLVFQRVVLVDPAIGAPLTVRLMARLVGATEGRCPLPGTSPWRSWLAPASGDAQAEPAADAPALLIPSAGPPRRWPRFEHRQLGAGVAQLAVWTTDTMPGHDTWLVLRPPWTSLGFVVLLGLIARLRVRAVVLSPAEPREIGAALGHLRPTTVVSGGNALASVLADPRATGGALRSVRAWIVDEPVAEPVQRAATAQLGIAFCPGLGHEHVAGLACCSPINGRRVAGSVGLPLPDVQARVVGPNGAPLATGQWGRLEMRGPNWCRRGWVEVAPRGRVDASGFVHVGRPGSAVSEP